MQQVGKFLGTLKMRERRRRKRRHHSWREVWYQLVVLHLPEEGEIQVFNLNAVAKNCISAPHYGIWKYFIDFYIQRQWIFYSNSFYMTNMEIAMCPKSQLKEYWGAYGHLKMDLPTVSEEFTIPSIPSLPVLKPWKRSLTRKTLGHPKFNTTLDLTFF